MRVCERCGRDFPMNPRGGRPPRYCSPECAEPAALPKSLVRAVLANRPDDRSEAERRLDEMDERRRLELDALMRCRHCGRQLVSESALESGMHSACRKVARRASAGEG
jgi:hypothetical protein